MKKIISILVLIVLTIIAFLVFVSADDDKLSEDVALSIGEEKYLDFLWMVDGAFNNEKLQSEILVNGKRQNNKIFACTYNKKTNTCLSNNFNEEFNRLFVKRIKPENVYGDGITYSWINYTKDGYEFTNSSSCNVKRMSLNQTLKVTKIMDNTIEYIIGYEDSIIEYLFVLEKEDNNWKISKAYYHDLCKMEYYIE